MKMELLQKIDYKQSIKPLNYAAGTTNGEIIDRLGFASALMPVYAGVSEGTPDSFTVTITLQHGDNSGLSDAATLTNVTFVISAVSTGDALYLNLLNAKRYIRIVSVVAFVGGSTPKINVQGGFILGDPAKAKVNNYDVYDVGNNKKMAEGNW